MDPLSQLCLSRRTDWLNDILGECVVYLPLVVVNRNDWVGEVTSITKHVQGILQGHQIVVHLVQPVAITNDLLEEDWEECSLPVKESTSGRLAHHCLPAADYL